MKLKMTALTYDEKTRYMHRQHLYYRYVDRLKETLKQMLSLADKMVFLEKQMVVKYKDADSELREIQPKLELVIKRTKEMQKQVSIF